MYQSSSSWATRIRTLKCWSQSPVPYHLAIAQCVLRSCATTILIIYQVFKKCKYFFEIFLIFFKKYFIHTILQILKCRNPHKMGHYASISCLVYASLGLSNISRVSPISTTRPSFMTIILSHNWYTTSISCDIKI